VTRFDRQALRVAHAAYAAARAEREVAQREAEKAWVTLQASPDTIEYQIAWNLALRHEAAAVDRLSQAERDYTRAGGYALADPED
jgi:hypothetical protein